jgi:hypothetical protein
MLKMAKNSGQLFNGNGRRRDGPGRNYVVEIGVVFSDWSQHFYCTRLPTYITLPVANF